jgi:hypothetical protein
VARGGEAGAVKEARLKIEGRRRQAETRPLYTDKTRAGGPAWGETTVDRSHPSQTLSNV